MNELLEFLFNVIFCLIPRPINTDLYIKILSIYPCPMLLETNENLSRGWKRRSFGGINSCHLIDYIGTLLLISSLDEVTGDLFYFFCGWICIILLLKKVPSNMVKGTFFENFSRKFVTFWERKLWNRQDFWRIWAKKFIAFQKQKCLAFFFWNHHI